MNPEQGFRDTRKPSSFIEKTRGLPSKGSPRADFGDQTVLTRITPSIAVIFFTTPSDGIEERSSIV